MAEALGDKTKLKYVKDSMTDYDGKLYRIEESLFTLDRKNLKVGGTLFSNHYTKSSCQIFVYPNMKPIEVIDNEEDCPYYEEI